MISVPLETTEPAAQSVDWGVFWGDVGKFFTDLGWNLLTVVIIVVVAILLAWLLRRLIHRVVSRIVNGAKDKAQVDDTQALERSPLAAVRLVQRTRTLGTILKNIVNVTIFVIAILLTINVLAPTALGSLTLLTAAVGAGLGFGAQNIVKDVLNGMFIVAEDQIGIGDVVDLGLATGIVEYVSVRVTHVRDVNGTLWYVRNGEILRIGNMSQGWSRVIIDLAVPVDADISEVESAMLGAAKDLAHDPKWRTRVIEAPEVWGLESVSGDALVIRLVMKTRSNAKDDVARELRMRLKHAIDELGLQLPQLNSITLTGLDGAGRVRGANPPRTKPNPTVATAKVPTAKTSSTKTPTTKAAKAKDGTAHAADVDAKPVWRPKSSPDSVAPDEIDDAPSADSEKKP
ncbi:mechanosensitive ion channel family protein [Microbacterium rhizomatis]|uniref:Mechanosensitive ion channel n=1 Tax=Microbacterium rhizomatis TaxID=1631477 RepID=A0A5J5J3N3_9MICO|nr:mechanosensitive ion channel domain-containing protein [Microbacterium rhizomatis]KAA9110671.1 mechanosensitive ion channel [Microbacterium rhizomatis]